MRREQRPLLFGRSSSSPGAGTVTRRNSQDRWRRGRDGRGSRSADVSRHSSRCRHCCPRPWIPWSPGCWPRTGASKPFAGCEDARSSICSSPPECSHRSTPPHRSPRVGGAHRRTRVRVTAVSSDDRVHGCAAPAEGTGCWTAGPYPRWRTRGHSWSQGTSRSRQIHTGAPCSSLASPTPLSMRAAGSTERNQRCSDSRS